MQVAHLISQLIEKASLPVAPAAMLSGSLRAFSLWRQLAQKQTSRVGQDVPVQFQD